MGVIVVLSRGIRSHLSYDFASIHLITPSSTFRVRVVQTVVSGLERRARSVVGKRLTAQGRGRDRTFGGQSPYFIRRPTFQLDWKPLRAGSRNGRPFRGTKRKTIETGNDADAF